ncbi:MAG: peptide chain release factor N(5)-glutamine methyltransferase [Ferruginibacter sp.]
MNLRELYLYFLKELSTLYELNEAAVISDRVFESVAAITKPVMIADPAKQLNESITDLLKKKLQELLQHRPVQYVLGEAWFYKLKFKVDENVLIPRPETEELVDIVINELRSAKEFSSKSLLDIGTGSGCIPVTIKKNLPEVNITAIDISAAALSIAMENAQLHHAIISFKEIDFLNKDQRNQLGEFDIIVSNPPYIPVNEIEKMDRHVTDYEPHTALFVPENSPLLFYKNIAAFGQLHLKKGGKIFMETHEAYAKKVADHFATFYKNVNIVKDISGKERMVIAS